MATYKITAEMNLKKIITKSREVAQALNEFADNIERIEKKYTDQEEKSCSNCKYWLLDNNDKNRKCKYCFEMDEFAAESEDKE